MAGKDGAKGSQGKQGIAGATGQQGIKGDTGPTGPVGAQGLTGATGEKGEKGEQGIAGVAGSKGDKGDTGSNGADGLTTSVNGVTQVEGAITLTKSNIGLANIDNTSDANKPVSIATQTALDLKAPLVSPVFVTPNLGVASATSINGLNLSAETTGFKISGGTTSKTLTVSDNATVSGTNTGDQTLPTLVRICQYITYSIIELFSYLCRKRQWKLMTLLRLV